MPDAAPEVVADGVRLAELIDHLPLSRGSVFELIKTLGIVTEKGPGPGGKGRVAWLSAESADRLADAAQRVHRGEVRIADLSGLATQQTRQTVPPAASAPSADSADPGPFLARLEAAERAIRSGLGLSTNETAWILGVRPGSAVVVRGGIRARRTGWNCWRMESADSPDAADRNT
jgi:hypothetical protein